MSEYQNDEECRHELDMLHLTSESVCQKAVNYLYELRMEIEQLKVKLEQAELELAEAKTLLVKRLDQYVRLSEAAEGRDNLRKANGMLLDQLAEAEARNKQLNTEMHKLLDELVDLRNRPVTRFEATERMHKAEADAAAMRKVLKMMLPYLNYGSGFRMSLGGKPASDILGMVEQVLSGTAGAKMLTVIDLLERCLQDDPNSMAWRDNHLELAEAIKDLRGD